MPLEVPPSLQTVFSNGTNAEQRFLSTGNPLALDQALECWRTIRVHASFATAEERFRRIILNNTGKAYFYRYQALHNLQDLDQASDYWSQALAMVATDSPDRPVYLNNLGTVISTRYDLKKNPADLDEAIRYFTEAAKIASSPYQFASFHYNLGAALFKRYQNTQDLTTFEKAIEAHEKAVSVATTNTPNATSMVHQHGVTLHERYRRKGDPKDLELAINCYLGAIQYSNAQNKDIDTYWNDCGIALRERYSLTNDPAWLEQAINCGRQAILHRQDADEFALHLANLGMSLHDRYVRDGTSSDLDEAIQLHQQALKLTTEQSTGRVPVVNGLAACLNDQYKRTNDIADLNAAIGLWSGALKLVPATSPDRGMVLANLGEALRVRYEAAGDLQDLNAAIANLQQALPLAGGPVTRASRLNGVAISQMNRFARTGDPNDLEQAISALVEAIKLTPANSADLFLRLNNLAIGMHHRYLRSGDISYLDEAIDLWRRVESLVTANSVERPRMLHELGKGLYDRYLRRHQRADLKAVIDAWEEAERLAPTGSSRSIFLNALGNGLLQRYELDGNIDDLNRAIKAWEDGLQLTASGSPSRPLRLNSLGIGLRKRFAVLHAPADIDQAVTHLQEAVELSKGTPTYPVALSNVANALSDRYAASAKAEDMTAAVAAWEGSCQSGLTLRPEATLAAARNWGEFAAQRQHWSEAARAYQYGATAVENLFRAQLLRGNKESWLHEARGLHARGAYAYAAAGDARLAVQMLEQGRARLMADAMERDRARLEQLPALGFAELYQQYTQAAQRITRGGVQEIEQRKPPSQKEVAELRDAHEELDKAIAAIQKISGYEDLFRALSFDQIQQFLAAPDVRAGVYLLATQFGGAALIVDTTGARYLPLELTVEGLVKLLVQASGDTAVGYFPAQMGQGSLPAALKDLLPSIGDLIAAPIAATLRQSQELKEPAPGLVLIPTGATGLLPLHAASYSVGGKTRSLLDEFAVSYTPSARVLGYARDGLQRSGSGVSSFLGISNPASQGAPALQFAAMEVDEIATFFPAHATVLTKDSAARTAVEAALEKAKYLHFACHGRFRIDDPLHSSVLLSGADELTVADLLAGSRLTDTRMAVLSACQSAITDAMQLPDEFVGLPAGFLQAGATSVIGSLWPVDDVSTALLMIELYRWHVRPPSGDPLSPARALRKAQLWLRDVTAAQLSQLFAAYKKAAPDAPANRMAYATACEQFVNFTLGAVRPGDHPFAGAYNWAAFCCYGV
jgi:CHAT domain-containing protein/tetratricopeptide (TPR) repeat protein